MNQISKRKLVVSEWVTLDGVFDANTMEQWFNPYDSINRQKYIKETVLKVDAFLFGRTTYEMLAPYWSSLKDDVIFPRKIGHYVKLFFQLQIFHKFQGSYIPEKNAFSACYRKFQYI